MNYAITPYIIIARSKALMLESLFKPVDGRTASGYVRKVLPSGKVKLHIMGEDFTLNNDHVFCLETKQANGSTWYSYGGDFKGVALKNSLFAESELETAIRSMSNA